MEVAKRDYQQGRRELGLGQFRVAMDHFDRAQGAFRAQGWHLEGDECGRRAHECWNCIALIRKDAVTESHEAIQIGNLYRHGDLDIAAALYVKAGVLCAATQPEEAAKQFEAAKSIGSPEAQLRLWELRETVSPEAAIRIAKLYRDGAPFMGDLLEAGIWFAKGGDFVESSRAFRKLIDLRGNDEIAEMGLRNILASTRIKVEEIIKCTGILRVRRR